MQTSSVQTARPLVLTIAIVLLVLKSLASLGNPLLPGVPVVVKVIAVVLALLGFVAAYGLWNRKRWGMIVAIIVLAINILLAVPGLLAQLNPISTTAAAVGIVVSLLIIILTVLPAARAAYR